MLIHAKNRSNEPRKVCLCTVAKGSLIHMNRNDAWVGLHSNSLSELRGDHKPNNQIEKRREQWIFSATAKHVTPDGLDFQRVGSEYLLNIWS